MWYLYVKKIQEFCINWRDFLATSFRLCPWLCCYVFHAICAHFTRWQTVKSTRATHILYTYKYRRLETSRRIRHECHTKSLRKSHKNTSDRHGNNGFVKHTKFPTRFICYGKFHPHFKTKKSNNSQIFANPTGFAIPPCYAVLPDQITKYSWKLFWNVHKKFTYRKLKIGSCRNTSETVGMYGNSQINTKRHLKKGYPFLFLSLY